MSWENHLTRGSIALARADYALAQDQLNQALTEVKAQRRASDSRVSTVYSLLAQAFYRQGDYKKAVPLLKQAIATDDRHNNMDTSSKARDLICLAEIARHDGNVEEAAGHINKAIENLQYLQRSQNGFGAEATHALSALFSKVSLERKLEQKQKLNQIEVIKNQFREFLVEAEKTNNQSATSSAVSASGSQAYFGTETQSPDNYWLENYESGTALGASREESKLESSYVLLLEALHTAAVNFSLQDTRFICSLTALAQTTTRLDLVELTEEILRYCQKLAVSQKVERQGMIEIKLAFADFYSYLCDFKTSAIYFSQAAALIEQPKTQEEAEKEDTSSTFNYNNALSFTASFVAMMQKSDLHQSAKLLTQQGLECEESQDWKQATALFEKALLLLEQIFPYDHLEFAQLLHFMTASLLGEGRVDEAVTARTRAEEIEEAAQNSGQILESRLRRLPKIKVEVFNENR
ncbi:MAG: tetratricopeptide repeat protein [Candidatus Obscuribacterales bacterium]|nr:tetratricopeptide repeat protein [Candidatus Obscuribacterales bacterium]